MAKYFVVLSSVGQFLLTLIGLQGVGRGVSKVLPVQPHSPNCVMEKHIWRGRRVGGDTPAHAVLKGIIYIQLDLNIFLKNKILFIKFNFRVLCLYVYILFNIQQLKHFYENDF